jgi:hypothetical protein
LCNLEQLLAGRAVGGGQRRIGTFSLRGLKPRITLLRVLVSVVAQSAQQADVRRCIPGDFAEGRVVALDEYLIGQIIGAGRAPGSDSSAESRRSGVR